MNKEKTAERQRRYRERLKERYPDHHSLRIRIDDETHQQLKRMTALYKEKPDRVIEAAVNVFERYKVLPSLDYGAQEIYFAVTEIKKTTNQGSSL